MKATLKHVANKYILIVDERPKIGDKYLSIFTNNGFTRESLDDRRFLSNHWKVIAAENLDGVKGIALRLDDRIITDIELISDFFNEYRFIDTEVEVTEEEDYYLIRL